MDCVPNFIKNAIHTLINSFSIFFAPPLVQNQIDSHITKKMYDDLLYHVVRLLPDRGGLLRQVHSSWKQLIDSINKKSITVASVALESESLFDLYAHDPSLPKITNKSIVHYLQTKDGSSEQAMVHEERLFLPESMIDWPLVPVDIKIASEFIRTRRIALFEKWIKLNQNTKYDSIATELGRVFCQESELDVFEWFKKNFRLLFPQSPNIEACLFTMRYHVMYDLINEHHNFQIDTMIETTKINKIWINSFYQFLPMSCAQIIYAYESIEGFREHERLVNHFTSAFETKHPTRLQISISEKNLDQFIDEIETFLLFMHQKFSRDFSNQLIEIFFTVARYSWIEGYNYLSSKMPNCDWSKELSWLFRDYHHSKLPTDDSTFIPFVTHVLNQMRSNNDQRLLNKFVSCFARLVLHKKDPSLAKDFIQLIDKNYSSFQIIHQEWDPSFENDEKNHRFINQIFQIDIGLRNDCLKQCVIYYQSQTSLFFGCMDFIRSEGLFDDNNEFYSLIFILLHDFFKKAFVSQLIQNNPSLTPESMVRDHFLNYFIESFTEIKLKKHQIDHLIKFHQHFRPSEPHFKISCLDFTTVDNLKHVLDFIDSKKFVVNSSLKFGPKCGPFLDRCLSNDDQSIDYQLECIYAFINIHVAKWMSLHPETTAPRNDQHFKRLINSLMDDNRLDLLAKFLPFVDPSIIDSVDSMTLRQMTFHQRLLLDQLMKHKSNFFDDLNKL